MDLSIVKTATKTVGETLSKNSPTILTGLGVAGLISTTILAVSATPKALKLLETEYQRRKSENFRSGLETDPLTKLEKVKVAWKCYIPTAIMGTITMACIISANNINLRRNAALASIYSLTEATLREYQEKVIETIGKNKEEKVKEAILQDKLNDNPVGDAQIILTGKGDTLCFDSLSGRYFKSDIESIRKIQNEFNRELINESYKTLNDLYYELGLEDTDLGRNMGWDLDHGLLDISFTAKIATDGQPCIVLSYRVEPRRL